jgi:hypothetical protein
LGSFVNEGASVSRAWPDISRKIYYMPHSTICYMAVGNESESTEVHPDPITGRPVLISDGHHYQ